MKVLFTGKGSAGSWLIRGEQMGAALGATVQRMAPPEVVAAHDIVVLVKRAPRGYIEMLKASGKPVVYDVVDCWRQPDRNDMAPRDAREWLRRRLADIAPAAAIFGTEAMREDAQFSGPSVVLPHHARPGQARHVVGEKVRHVGYEGRVDYLGPWRGPIETACAERGWSFVVNPVSLASLDIGIAVRGGVWDGYMPRNWKSNVKLANFQAVGLPCILFPEAAYRETSRGGPVWVSDPAEVGTAFDRLASLPARQRAQDLLLADAPRVALPAIAAEMKCFLDSLA